jgi:hypothetical protein
VQTVNTAFSKFHTDLMHMRSDSKSDAAKKIVDDADAALKTLRQNAVKDIHATSACAKAENDDEDANEQDNDENDDNDSNKSEKHSETNFLVVLLGNLFGNNTSTTSTNTTLTTTGDPKAIADAAVAAMKLAFDDAVAQLQALPTASPKPTKAPHATNTTKGQSESHGKGSSRAPGGDD